LVVIWLVDVFCFLFGSFSFFMRVNLNVPYSEKDEAKRLGAKWDYLERTWYVQDMENLCQFLRWIPEHLKKPHQRIDHSDTDDFSFFLRIQDREEKPHRKTKHPKEPKILIESSKPMRGANFVETICDCLPWIGCEKCRM